MIREIYFRDPSDPKYRSNKFETNSELEMVLNQVRMILMTGKGEVFGDYDFGLDLDAYLFEFGFNESVVRSDFLTQVEAYIPNSRYSITVDFDYESDGITDTIYLYISIDDTRMIGIVI